MVLYPIFVQMYLELVYNNHETNGTNYSLIVHYKLLIVPIFSH